MLLWAISRKDGSVNLKKTDKWVGLGKMTSLELCESMQINSISARVRLLEGK